MYERFYGFRERPFELTPNPRHLVLTNGHREAISSIEYAIATAKGITLLIGEAGAGKTTVIRAAIERQPAPVHCIYLHNPALTRPEFIAMLSVRFGLSPEARNSKAVLLWELETLLQERHQANETTVLIVDEAQTLSPRLLEEIRLLANIETNEEKLLSVVLAGQPELATLLDDPSMSQLKQRIALCCELHPLTFRETASYILGRIRSAGGTAADIFTIEAVTLIHEAARGIPRIINVIADNALITGFAAEQRPVHSEIVQHVCREMRIRQGSDIPTAIVAAPSHESPPETPSDDVVPEGEADTSGLSFTADSPVSTEPEPSSFAKVSRRYFS